MKFVSIWNGKSIGMYHQLAPRGNSSMPCRAGQAKKVPTSQLCFLIMFSYCFLVSKRRVTGGIVLQQPQKKSLHWRSKDRLMSITLERHFCRSTPAYGRSSTESSSTAKPNRYRTQLSIVCRRHNCQSVVLECPGALADT